MTSLLSRDIYLSFDLIRVYLCWDFKLRIFFFLKNIPVHLPWLYINFYSRQWVQYLFSSKITELEGTEWKSFGFVFVWIQSLRPKGWDEVEWSRGSVYQAEKWSNGCPTVLSGTWLPSRPYFILHCQLWNPCARELVDRPESPVIQPFRFQEVMSELDRELYGKLKVSAAEVKSGPGNLTTWVYVPASSLTVFLTDASPLWV